MVLRLCQGCGEATPNRPALCDRCKAQRPERKREATRYYDVNLRDKRAAAFYRSAAWRKARTAYLASIGYLCEDCADEARDGLRRPEDVSVATDVHHVVPLAVDWSQRLTWGNFRGLCDAHHKRQRVKK